MTPDVQGRNSVGALHDDDATDSDKTVDLGPEKFVYSAQKRKTMVPVEPVTPKRQKRTAPPAANNTTNGESSDSHKVSVSAPETQGMPSKLDAAGSRNRESVDPGGPNGRSSHQQDEESSLEHAGEDVPKVTRQRSQDLGYQPRKRRRLDVWEGSIGFLRRKIISDILEKCNGVMPFGFPLWQTFATAWQRTGRATRPDARTLKTAVKGLVDSGQMKQLKFSFKDKNGLMHTQSMLVRPNIKVGDDVVRQMQKKIIEAFPRSYRPEQFEIDSSFRVRDTRPPTGQHHPYETVHDELVQTSRTYVKARNAERVRQNQELRERIANNLLPQRRPIVANQPRVSRLERIGGPHRLVKTKQDARLEFLLPSAQTITFGTLDSNPSEGSPDDRQGLIPQQLPDPKSEASMARELLNDRKQKELPHSLADVPDRRRKKIDHLNTGDPAYSKFQWDLDKVEKWEARKQSLFDDEAPETWQFINHKLTGPHDTVAIEGPLKFGAWSCFNESGVETIYSEPLEAGKSMQPSSALLISERGAHRSKRGRKPHQSQVETIPDKETEVRGSMPAPGRRAKYGPIQRKFIGTNQDVRQPTKQRRVEQLETIKFDPRVLFPDAKKLSRGPQVLKQLPEEMIHKLLITFVVMRVLVGGVEKLIDFSLVNMVFPDETEQFLKDRWRTMRNKYRHLMRRYTEDFQDHYLRAYENDEVPAIDYDDLPGNDWDAIVEWAMTVMEKPMQHDVEDLPDSRKDLDYSRQLIVETSNRPLREIYAYNTNATIPHREYVIAATPFAIPVVEAKGISKDLPSDLISPEVSQPVKQAPNELHAVARSWVLATVLTPDEQYSGIAATSKISQLPNYNNLVEVSIKSLVSSRIISHAGAGSKVTLSNRAYDISEHFMNTISRKRLINHEMLRRAMWYKINVLDPAFSVSSNRIKFDVDLVEEGDMVAVLNLAASGRIVIRPSRSQKKGEKVPANRYGLTNSYQTRFIEKDLFKFAVEIEPVGDRSWISGNPLLSPQGTSPIRLKVHAKESLVDRYPVPRGGMDLPPPLPGSTVADATDPNFNSTSAIPQQQAPPSPSPSTSTTVTPGRIPLYFTIHSTFIPSIWTMLISATVGLIAIRPGISTVEIARMLSPAIALEDLRMVLQWLKGVGAIKGGEEENRMGIRGWETCEWWWCVCE
ncbi:putative tfiiic transcription initiation factor complex subunits tfc3 [Phaeomoniella chlamydospora]|uniref:Putative tfiiic transcription initiation factor complex subunits tfc3 n=1 Tax=Phaeomoniella chlamydospora TaxID=158046 RepID=A0A0G2EY49_PHACM|nr:putative tfiiic transcription initiation factor complex subunits tfc3 [Phaeomoniella chlamydospora]